MQFFLADIFTVSPSYDAYVCQKIVLLILSHEIIPLSPPVSQGERGV